MASNKIWISYSSIVDFNNCSRLYYFKNQYRNPKTNNRVQIVNPYLSLGCAVHETIDEIINFSPSKRLKTPLIKKYDKIWKKYSGKKGGFFTESQEKEFKKRGIKMLQRFKKSALISKKTLKKEKDLPKTKIYKDTYLVGSFDWVEVLKNNNLHIVDFKTGRSQEKKSSWQLLIYQLLAQDNYERQVDKLSYCYLDKSSKLISKKSISLDDFVPKIKEKADQIEKLIKNKKFSCQSKYNRCYWCRDYESIVSGKTEYVGTDEIMKKDLYFLNNSSNVLRKIDESNFLTKKEKEILKVRISDNINDFLEENKMSKKEIKKTVNEIKEKLKNNLSRKELLFFIEKLEKNGKKINL